MEDPTKALPDISLGVDVGGTFTDAALVVDGQLFTAKVPTTPADQSDGVMSAVQLALEGSEVDPFDVSRFAHGMTVATNALLEQKGARTALLTTRGFEDVVEIARQTRPELYRLCVGRPTPLVPPDLRFGVVERNAPDGIVEVLDETQLASTIEALASAGVESVAISLLHSYAHPDHERRVQDAVEARLPGVHVSRSSELLPVFREYERTSTTVIDAYLSPLLRDYLRSLERRCDAVGLARPEIMQSNGGLIPAAEAARHAGWTVLSGPAAGTIGAGLLGSRCGHDRILSFDMGGTSCDVAVIDEGRVRQTTERTIAGRVLQLPLADIHTVGAGGGSIGWADAGGALRVGPQSAGAEPGPASYGRDGTDPTVTDANLVLGYLGPGSRLSGQLQLDVHAARLAVERLGERLDLDIEQTAEGILRVADQEMLGALRVVTVERGVDPRNYVLVAFGGAGPMHATRIADQLEIPRVLCPRSAGVLSALGLATSDQRRDFARSVMLRGSELTATALADQVDQLSAKAIAAMPDARLELSFDLRYTGQAFELSIEGSPRSSPDDLRARFDSAHASRYGYSDAEAELELVNVRVTALVPHRVPEIRAGRARVAARSTRPALFDGAWLETAVWSGQPRPGESLRGPAIVELDEATIVVPPGWKADVDSSGTAAMERSP